MSDLIRSMVHVDNFVQIAQKKILFSKLAFLKIILILNLFCLAGCQETELLENLDSEKSIKIISVLSDAGVESRRQSSSSTATGAYNISVDREDYRKALKIVSEIEHDPAKDVVNKIINPNGLSPSSPEIVAYRLDYLLAKEIEGLLLNLKGVLSVKVSVKLVQLKNNQEDLEQKPSVTVLINYLKSSSENIEKAEIEDLVKNLVSGAKDLKVLIALKPVDFQNVSTSSKNEGRLGQGSSDFMLAVVGAGMGIGVLFFSLGYFYARKGKKLVSLADKNYRTAEESFFDQKPNDEEQ